MNILAITYSDCKTLAQSWFEETLDDADILIWGNEFLQRIVSDKLWTETSQAFASAVADTPVALPAGFIRSVKVTEDTNDDEYTSFTIKNGYITFADSGSYHLAYVAYPTALTTIATAIPLPDIFKYPLAEFFIFKYYKIELDDDDSYNAAQEYELRYLNSLKKIYEQMELDSEMDSFQVKMRW